VIELEALARRLEELEQRQVAIEGERDEAKRQRDAYHKLYLDLMERYRKLERGLVGKTVERLREDGAQLSLAVLGLALDEREAAAIDDLQQEEVRAHKRAKPTGRKPIPDDLPRVEIEIVPDEVRQEGLDAFERIGEEVTEVLERRPASLVVARVIKPKFVRKARDRQATEVFVGATPALPIERGLAGPGLLADTIVRRWQDHLPANRLEGIYAREGIELARSTICGWHGQLTPLVEPLVAAMRADAFEQPFLCTDATGVLVQAKEQCRRGHFWVLVAPGKHVLFEYTRNHTSSAVDSLLAGYEGYLVADAHIVYDHLYARGDVVEVNCWAHARRYFFKALESDPARARAALVLIGRLFKIERSIATAPRKKREKIRAKHSAPIVERFFSWCDAEFPTLLEDTPIYDGVRYARNQRQGLKRFLEDGRLPLHNNVSERELRRQAVGRKNWLFVGSDDGAQTNAAFTSLLASCRMVNVEPWAYLRDIFCLLPKWPSHRLLELAPANWNATAVTDEVANKLAADPFRALTLDRG
jgi:transposase